jgi:hypothetical protein
MDMYNVLEKLQQIENPSEEQQAAIKTAESMPAQGGYDSAQSTTASATGDTVYAKLEDWNGQATSQDMIRLAGIPSLGIQTEPTVTEESVDIEESVDVEEIERMNAQLSDADRELAKATEELQKELIAEKKLSDKDYDGDGRIESPEKEYKDSKDKAIKKAMGKLKEALTDVKKIKEGTWHIASDMSGLAKLMRKPIPVKDASNAVADYFGDDELEDAFIELEQEGGPEADARPTIEKIMGERWAEMDDDEQLGFTNASADWPGIKFDESDQRPWHEFNTKLDKWQKDLLPNKPSPGERYVKCEHCDGKGQHIDSETGKPYECKHCHGTGWLMEDTGATMEDTGAVWDAREEIEQAAKDLNKAVQGRWPAYDEFSDRPWAKKQNEKSYKMIMKLLPQIKAMTEFIKKEFPKGKPGPGGGPRPSGYI